MSSAWRCGAGRSTHASGSWQPPRTRLARSASVSMSAGRARSVRATRCGPSPARRWCSANRLPKRAETPARAVRFETGLRGLGCVTEPETLDQIAQRFCAGPVVLALAKVKRLGERALGFIEAIGLGACGPIECPEARVRFFEQRGFAQRDERLTAFTALLSTAGSTE